MFFREQARGRSGRRTALSRRSRDGAAGGRGGGDPARPAPGAPRVWSGRSGERAEPRRTRHGFVEHLRRDTRHAARRLRRDWRFTLAAVLILGLGIGVNAAIFSVINAVLFRPQAVVNPDTLVDIYQNAPGGAPTGNSYAAYLDMAAYTDIFAGSAVTFIPHPVTYSDGGPPRQASWRTRRPSYLTVLGLRPALGRWFTESRGRDERASGGRHRLPRMDDAVCVRPRRRRPHHPDRRHAGDGGRRRSRESRRVDELRRPHRLLDAAQDARRCSARRRRRSSAVSREPAFMVKARLRPGVTVAQAQAAMTALGARLAREFPKEDKRAGISVFASRDVRIHPQMDAILAGFATALLAHRRARARHRLQQSGHAAAGARRRAGQGSVGAAGGRRHARAARAPSPDRERAAGAGGRRRRLRAGVVDDAVAEHARSAGGGGFQPRPPRARLRAARCRS